MLTALFLPRAVGVLHEATHLSASDWDELQHTIRHRVLRYFHRQGLLERHVTAPLDDAAHISG